MSKATKINKNQLAKFIDYLENKNRKNDNNTINGCVEFLKTALYTSPSFIYDTTLETHLKTKKFFEEINFDSLSTDHLFNIGSILQQGADIKTFTCFISTILNKNDVKFNVLLIDTWNYLGLNTIELPVFIHEYCIEMLPFLFEKTVLLGISSLCYKKLVNMCTTSPIVFQACSSILNEILIKTNFSNQFLIFLNTFLKDFYFQCKKNNVDIHTMYPSKYKYLLILQDIEENSDNVTISGYFLQEIKKVLSSYPKELICLLSHFPNLFKNLPLSNIH